MSTPVPGDMPPGEIRPGGRRRLQAWALVIAILGFLLIWGGIEFVQNKENGTQPVAVGSETTAPAGKAPFTIKVWPLGDIDPQNTDDWTSEGKQVLDANAIPPDPDSAAIATIMLEVDYGADLKGEPVKMKLLKGMTWVANPDAREVTFPGAENDGTLHVSLQLEAGRQYKPTMCFGEDGCGQISLTVT